MFEVAGTFGPILLGLGGVGALIALALAGVGILGKRVPLLAWLFMPSLIILVGAVGSWSGVGGVESALDASVGADIGAVSSVGLAEAYGARWLAHWVVAALSAFSVWCAALSALIKPGGETRATPFVAIMALLLSALTPAGTVWFALSNGLGTQALVFIGLVSAAGAGCALVAFRRALHEAAYRVASLRFASGVLMVFTVAHGARALVLHGTMERLALRSDTPFDQLVEATTAALAMQVSITTLCWVVFGVGLAIALFTFLGEMGEVVDKFALFDGTVVLLLLAGVGVFRVAETDREATLLTTASVHPLGDLLGRYGYQLPAAAVSGYTKSFDLRGDESLFGDVIVYGTRPSYVQPPVAEGESPPARPQEWYRAYAWTGHAWEADDTAIADLQPPGAESSPGRPAIAAAYPALIAGPSSTSSEDLVALLRQVGGEAHILMRISEMAQQIEPDLAWTQARWVHLKLTEGIDYATESYAQTERYDPYFGAARFIEARKTNEKPIHRIHAMIEEHGVTAIRATVGERTRLDHLVGLCIATQAIPGMEPELDDQEEAPTDREGFECTEVDITIDDAITGAVEALGMPTSDNATLTVTVEEGLDPATVQVVQRELEAFGACAGQVQEDMGEEERITGRLAGSFTVDDRGRAGRFEFEEERRDITIYDMKLCVRERLEWSRFPEYVHPEPPAPEIGPDGEEIEVEPIPFPRAKFVLNYR